MKTIIKSASNGASSMALKISKLTVTSAKIVAPGRFYDKV